MTETHSIFSITARDTSVHQRRAEFLWWEERKVLECQRSPDLVIQAGPCEVRQTGDYRSVQSETAPSGMECFMQLTSKEPFSTVCLNEHPT